MKRLSVCMIVKDEEAVLARCLDSVKDIADEIIIVDTGSADRTKEIASQYTELIYDYKWNNDFAAARNESISHASGKWILVLDADEYLSSTEIEAWKQFLNNQLPEKYIAYTLLVVNLSDEGKDGVTTGPVTRLFPNHQGILYKNPIHEQLSNINGNIYQKKIDLTIYHTGYQSSTVISKNKHQRNMGIFDEMKLSGKMSAYDYFTLGNQYTCNKEYVQAIDAYELSIEMITNKSIMWYPYCLMSLIGVYLNQNHLEKSWELIESELIHFIQFPEYHTMKGLHLEALGFKDEASVCYKEAINRAEEQAVKQTDFWLVNPDFGFEVPITQLMNLSFEKEQNSEAIYWLTKLLQKNKKNTKYVIKLLEWLSQHENEQAILELLNQLYDVNDTSDSFFLFKVALALGVPGIVEYYSKLVPQDLKLSYEDLTRLALINNDYTSWEQYSDQIELSNNTRAWLQITLGSLIWNNKKKFRGEHFTEINSLLLNVVEDNPIDHSKLHTFTKELFLIAKDLFLQRRFELFDSFVTKVSHPELINMMANYFYKIKLVDIAMQYYSILLNQGKLDIISYENLGLYHANHQYTEEAVEFLSEVLKIDPNKRYLYNILLENMSDGAQKEQLIKTFSVKFPELLSISFIKMKFEENMVGNPVETKLEIAFMPYKASMWDSFDSIYREAVKDPDCNCYVVPIPYYEKNAQGDIVKFCYEGNDLPKDITITPFEIYDFEVRKPNIIYIHNPYDNYNTLTMVNPRFFSDNLAQNTNMLVYVPYFIAGSTEGSNLAIMPSFNNVTKIITQSKSAKDAYTAAGLAADKLLDLGSPKLDAMLTAIQNGREVSSHWKFSIRNKKVFLLNTGIADLLSIDTWFKQLDRILSYFMNHEQHALIWRPHPLTEITLKTMRPNLVEKYEAIQKLLKQADHIIIDTNSDIYPAVTVSDGIISDYSSVLLQSIISEKPVLGLLSEQMTSEHRNYYADYRGCYFDNKDITLEEFVRMVEGNEDYKKEERIRRFKDSISNADGTSGQKIHHYIKNEVMRGKANVLR